MEEHTNKESTPFELSVDEAWHLLQTEPERILLVDVRGADECEICRIPSAQILPMKQIFSGAFALPHDRHLLIYCHKGGRSKIVTQYLRARGFDNASNIAGGIHEWAIRIDPGMKRY